MPFSGDLLSLIGLGLAAALTLITLSYIFGDHPLFRLVLHIFIGVSAGYAAAIALQEVIVPQLIAPIFEFTAGSTSIDVLDLGIRVALSLLLLSKLFPRVANLGNPASALLVGVGAALAVAGAVQGTLLPQVDAASNVFDLESFDLALQGGYYAEAGGLFFQGLLTLLATLGTLAYFHFGARSRGKLEPERSIGVDALAWFGSVFIPVTLATLFAGVLLTAFTALIERMAFLVDLGAFFLGIN